MAEMELAVQGRESQNTVIAPPKESTSDLDTSVPATRTETKPSEKLFTQSELEKIVGRTREQVRDEYYNRGKQEALSELNKQQNNQVNTTQNMGGISQLNDNQIDEIVEKKLKDRADAQAANQIAYDFVGKMQAAKDKYSDFEETVAQLNLPAHPHIVYWANSLDNTADVVYDIAKNPEKFAGILMLAQSAPELARRKLSELSNSIKKNEEALKQPNVNEPLSQLRPSSVGTDNGSMKVRDLRRQPWLRA